jgi:PncC family amidohydrolase
MKNALVIIKKDEYAFVETEIRAIFDVFNANGYAFDEVRALCGFNENKAYSVLQENVNEYDNVVCVTIAPYFSALCQLLGGIFAKGQSQVFGNTACFTENKKSCFVVCEENALVCLRDACIPHVQQKSGERYTRAVFRCVGASETRIKELFTGLKIYQSGIAKCKHTRRNAEDRIEILFTENVSKQVADNVMRTFASELQDCIYAMEDTTLEKQLVELLKIRGKRISVAESFTGGGIAKRITSVPGASAVYFEGINSYNELSKMKRLNVSDYTLHSYGAVSDNTAYEMAAGLIATGDCDFAIATTGYAGPTTDSSTLPVGLCYIAVGTKERVFVYRYKFDGDREKITETAIDYALFLAYKQLRNM